MRTIMGTVLLTCGLVCSSQGAEPAKRAPLQILQSCVAEHATADDLNAAVRTRIHHALTAHPSTASLAAQDAAQYQADTPAIGRAIERLAAVPCHEAVKGLRLGRPVDVVAIIYPLLSNHAARGAGPVLLAEQQSFINRVLNSIDPAVVARVLTVSDAAAAPMPADADPMQSPPLPVSPTDHVIQARIPPGTDLKALCSYPPASRRLQESGSVVVLLTLDAEGYVEQAELERATGYRRLDALALACLSGAQYIPAIVNGMPVPSKQRIRWTWKLSE